MNPARAFPATVTAFLAAALFLIAPTLRAEEADGSRRPRIGLVLSGGGARGVAHIGVLKALEELRIPIDCIAGTSIGAIIGGLYASGMSPEEIEDWFRSADWKFLLSDEAPRESQQLRPKQRDFDLNQKIELRVSRKKAVQLPAGLVQGRNLMASLRQLTIPARDIHDFDRLPIPFRAVATDIETGAIMVRGEGDLAEAMRASMAVPGFFAPLKIDGRLLVDGALASNLPVQTVQEMGADIIIAIDASPPLKKEAGLEDAAAIADQMLNIFIAKQTKTQLARLGPGDVYFKLQVGDVGPTEFTEGAKSIGAGYEQTMGRRAALAHLSAGPERFRGYLAGQRVPRPERVLISFIKVRTPSGETEHALGEPIEFQTKSPARFAPLQSTIAGLAPLQKFDIADYEVIGQAGAHGLLITTRERKVGRNTVGFGLDFAYRASGETDANLLLSHRMAELNSLGAEWSTFLSVGDSNRGLTEWYQPLDRARRFFVAPRAFFASEFIDGTDSARQPIRFRLQTVGAGLDAGVRVGQAGEFRFGYTRAVSRTGRRFGSLDDLPRTIDRGWAHAEFSVDMLDAPSFATRGYYGRASVVASREEFGADDNYTRLEGQFYKPLTFGKNTLVPRVSAGLKAGGGDIPIYDRFQLGGFLQLSGLARGDLYDQNALLAELICYRKIAELSPAVGRGIYAGFSLEAGEVAADIRDFKLSHVFYGGSVFLGADTLIGAMHLGVGLGEGGEAAVYLQLGPVFRRGQHQR